MTSDTQEEYQVTQIKLTDDQSSALYAIERWFHASPANTPYNIHQSFLLDGAAGTGKTFCLQLLLDTLPDLSGVLFTAPTNKAVRVLQQTLNDADIFSDCRTIYSALNLRMMPNGGVKELTVGDGEGQVNWDRISLCIVDEASMVGEKLRGRIAELQDQYPVRFLFVGDSAQLPPVGEPHSAVIANHSPVSTATLRKVVRQDNQILTLGTTLRGQIGSWAPKVTFFNDNDGQEGVWKYASQNEAERDICAAAAAGLFQSPTGVKAIAWRNVVVDKLNQLIRSQLYANAEELFCEGDRIILTEPCKELDAGGSLKSGRGLRKPMHSTDTEGTVNSCTVAAHPLYPEFQCYRISATSDDGQPMRLWVLHKDKKNQAAWKARKEELAVTARGNSRAWPAFWNFLEAFHAVRHGYAITAHRAQGSTYEQAFVHASDILCNQNRGEAFRCLYVACTRPKKRLFVW